MTYISVNEIACVDLNIRTHTMTYIFSANISVAEKKFKYSEKRYSFEINIPFRNKMNEVTLQKQEKSKTVIAKAIKCYLN